MKNHKLMMTQLLCGALMLSGCGPDDPAAGGDDSATGSGGSGTGNTGSDTTSDATGSEERAASGRTLFYISIHSLIGMDTGSHDETLWVTVTQDMTTVRDLEVTDDQVWLAREDGVVVATDREQAAILAEVDMQSLGTEDGEPVTASHIAVGEDFTYTTADSFGVHALVAIDKNDFEMTLNAEALSQANGTAGIVYDGSHVWVATGLAGNLYKFDATTLELVGSIDVSEVIANEPVAEGSWGGDTYLTHVGDFIWVIDGNNPRLLRVDRQTLEVTLADDLADVSATDDYFELADNDSDVFLMLASRDLVLRFDGNTGERLMQYEFADQGGVKRMTVNDQHLYLRDDPISPSTVLEVDIQSGATLQQIQPGRVDYPLAVD